MKAYEASPRWIRRISSLALLAIAVLCPARSLAQANAHEALLEQGREAFLNYEFDQAAGLYAKYKAAMKKARHAVDPELENDERRLELAQSFLERVEKIQIIDSITVPRVGFFKAFRLPPSAGSLQPASVLPFADSRENAESPVFRNEDGDVMIWAEPDSIGTLVLMEATKLVDGNWQRHRTGDDELSLGADIQFPFLMSDGTTLYFASDNEESMGGLDIFVSMRDAQTGEYLKPQNMGMPYNSPFDDYMMAIDEQNGVGWWATERNGLEDDVTIYVFIPNDLRNNWDADDEDIVSYARIDDIEATWEAESYDALLDEVAISAKAKPKKKGQFYFPITADKIYMDYSDFRTQGGKVAMQAYLQAEADLSDAQDRLRDLRKKYHAGKTSALKTEILRLEQEVERQRTQLADLKNKIYRAEKSDR